MDYPFVFIGVCFIKLCSHNVKILFNNVVKSHF